MVVAVVLAFLMTLITSSSNVILKKGFSRVHPFFAVYVSVGISVIVLWIITLIFVPRSMFANYKGIGIFLLIGALTPTIVRTLTYYGIHTLGASRAAPVRAMTPFFAVIIAMMFLKEAPKPIIFIGILFIVMGITVLTKDEEQKDYKSSLVNFAYPLIAAVLAGIIANLRKYGLIVMPQPVLGSTLTATSSLIVLTGYVLVNDHHKGKIKILAHKKEILLIILAALLTACGEIVDLSALLYGKVTLVIPIFATTPFMVALLAHVFLKKYEIVTKQLLLSAVLIAIGVVLTILSTF